MSSGIPRLRMFAGPNGSGKTTVKNGLQRPPEWFGIYINPDDLERSIRETGILSLQDFDLKTTTEEIRSFFASSSLLRSKQIHSLADAIEVRSDEIDFSRLGMNSYYASVLADFLRRKTMEESKSFSFETVMSSPDKIDLLHEAQARGFRTYLYFVATTDPAINIQRVRNRALEGGHDVPDDKIVSRYYRSLGLLLEAIRLSNRAFLFDTSGEQARFFAEVTEGTKIDLKSDIVPIWFQPIWKQF